MFSSLHKIDIVATKDSQQVAVQTDHRSEAEIASEFDLSVILVTARVLNPLILSKDIDTVRVAFASDPHEEFKEFVRSLGAEVELSDGTAFPPTLDETKRIEVVRASLKKLGHQVIDQYDAVVDESGLSKIQEAFHAKVDISGGLEEDEITYWNSVVELGAAIGVILDELFGGTWNITDEPYAAVPLLFNVQAPNGNTVTVNVFGKIEKYFEAGELEAPTQLLTMLSQQDDASEGQVMFSLRPKHWQGVKFAAYEPLLPAIDGDDGAGVPLVALIRDSPESIATIPAGSSEEELEDLKQQAAANIAEIQVEVQENEVGDATLLIVRGDYYAAEKILDTSFMKEISKRLDSEAIMAAVPMRGIAFIASALEGPQMAGALGMLAQSEFKGAPSKEQISPCLLMFQDGSPVAYAAPPEPDA